MRLKAGIIYLEDQEPDDAVWEYDSGGMVTVTHDDFVYLSIDPEDFFGISDAVKEKMNRDKNCKP